MKKILSLSLALLSLVGFTSQALAAKPGAYVGAGLGLSKLQTKNEYLIDSSVNANLTQKRKLGGLGEQVFAGYNFSEYFGIQGGFAHYAPSTYSSSLNGFNTDAKKDYYLNAFDVVGKAYLPISDSGFNVYGLGGVAYVRSQTDYKVTVLNQQAENISTKTSKFRPKYGVGVSYDFAQTPVGASIEWSRIQGSGKVDNSSNTKAIPNADMLAFQISYKID